MATIWFCLVATHAGGLRGSRWIRSRRGHASSLDRARRRFRAPYARAPQSDRSGMATKCGCSPTGGTLYFAFPALYASGFSGFYLPLMMVLWLLIIRGVALEFRSHVSGRGLDAVLGCRIFSRERSARYLLRRRAWKCRSWCSSRRERSLLRAAVDQFGARVDRPASSTGIPCSLALRRLPH